MDKSILHQHDSIELPNQQYSLAKIIMLWLLVTIPMGISRFYLFPILSERLKISPGIIFWLLVIVGMIWQFVLSLIVLRHELGKLTWAKLRTRLWLNHPIDPKTKNVRIKLYWYVIPIIIYTQIISSTDILNFLSEGFIAVFPFFEPPSAIMIQSLATPEFVGAWYVVAIMLISSLFNYLLGEELFFRGVLLPKMNGVFGKWDWAMNGILFASYHVHKIEEVPILIVGIIFTSYLNKKYKSFYPGLIIHGVEFIPLAVLVTLGVMGFLS